MVGALTRSIRQLAPSGRLNRLSSAIEEFLLDPNRFGVLLTVTPEQLALREALEAATALRELGIACVGAILNGVAPALFTAADLARLGALEGHLARAHTGRLGEVVPLAHRRVGDGLPGAQHPDRGLGAILGPLLARQDDCPATVGADAAVQLGQGIPHHRGVHDVGDSDGVPVEGVGVEAGVVAGRDGDLGQLLTKAEVQKLFELRTIQVGDKTYALRQFHFHHPSEEHVNRKVLP